MLPVDMGVQKSLSDSAFNMFGYVPKSEITENEIYFHLLISLLITSNNGLWFSVYKSFLA